MKNRFNDEQLDEMFKTYYSRKAPYTFRVKAAPTNKSRHGHRNAVKYALSVVCVLLVVFTVGFAFNGNFVNKFVNNNAGTEPAKPSVKYDDSFIIKAYTAEISDKYSSAQSIGKEKFAGTGQADPVIIPLPAGRKKRKRNKQRQRAEDRCAGITRDCPGKNSPCSR